MTVVRPYSQWGIAVIGDDDRIGGFEEKPRLDYWINGGFFCCEPGFLDWVDDDSVLEREPLGDRCERGASSPRIATTASGTAWTPTRTPSS